MGGFTDIARHFGLKAVYVLVAWGVSRVLDSGRKRLLLRKARTARPQPVESRPAPKPPARYKIYHNPQRDFQPSNPGWLVSAARVDPWELLSDPSWQCPLLVGFQAQLAGQGWSQQQHPQPQHPQQQQLQQPPSGADGCAAVAAAAADVCLEGGGGGGGGAGLGGGVGGGPPPPLLLLPPFGSPARQQLFALDPRVTHLNHGSYGAAFRLSLEVQSWYRQQMEGQPVRFMETVAVRGLVAAVADAARFIGAAPRDVVPVVNATSAVNAVLRSVPLRRGDWVLMFNTTYSAVRSSIARVAAAAGASILEVQLGLAEFQRPDTIVAAVQSSLQAVGGRRRVRLAVLDHVVSFPPIVMPVRQLAALCKQVC
ncbi:hypothetical protein Agub_g9450 [Astrephomene gubernaculifera]|uniref:Aminotransferase class V domain-containing protein n=1 Tax=Astrephomene gubernaculifera TaxID=47775 RepID=A0AAD3DTR6_9CHLO|nr:hypothetical protein Agub_g9450 [Astrephomene gubernaculifera]